VDENVIPASRRSQLDEPYIIRNSLFDIQNSKPFAMRPLLTLLLAALLAFAAQTSAAERPNIVLMMVDDLGFSDFGCYGSEIETPNIDALAAEGLRFSQFYNTAKCHSSRVSLLTGLWCNQAGGAKLNRGVTLAEVLGKAGYSTTMVGKWHLDKQPTDRGFEKYFGHLSGATNFFTGDNSFRLNGQPWNDFDEDFYTTDANIDYAKRFLTETLERDSD
jgi:arylsulfatase A-like enzyme